MTGRPIACEGVAVEPVAWVAAHDCMLYPDYKITNPILYGGPEFAPNPNDVVALYTQSAIDTLRAQLEAAERGLAGYIHQHRLDSRELLRLCGARDAMKARAEAAETDAARWRSWRELDEHAAAEIAWFAGGPEERDAEIDARTKEAAP